MSAEYVMQGIVNGELTRCICTAIGDSGGKHHRAIARVLDAWRDHEPDSEQRGHDGLTTEERRDSPPNTVKP